MRFLADEGVDETIVGSSADVILEAAVQDARTLITEDKAFGEIVYR